MISRRCPNYWTNGKQDRQLRRKRWRKMTDPRNSPDLRRKKWQCQNPNGAESIWPCKQWTWQWFRVFLLEKYWQARLAANQLLKHTATTMSYRIKRCTCYQNLTVSDNYTVELIHFDWKLWFSQGGDTYSSLTAMTVRDDGTSENCLRKTTIKSVRKKDSVLEESDGGKMIIATANDRVDDGIDRQ